MGEEKREEKMTYRDIELEWMKEILRDKEEQIHKLEQENKKLRKQIQLLVKEESN